MFKLAATIVMALSLTGCVIGNEIAKTMLSQMQNEYGKMIIEIIWTNREANKELMIPWSFKTESMKKAYYDLMNNTIDIETNIVSIFNLWCIIYIKSMKQKRYKKH